MCGHQSLLVILLTILYMRWLKGVVTVIQFLLLDFSPLFGVFFGFERQFLYRHCLAAEPQKQQLDIQ